MFPSETMVPTLIGRPKPEYSVLSLNALEIESLALTHDNPVAAKNRIVEGEEINPYVRLTCVKEDLRN